MPANAKESPLLIGLSSGRIRKRLAKGKVVVKYNIVIFPNDKDELVRKGEEEAAKTALLLAKSGYPRDGSTALLQGDIGWIKGYLTPFFMQIEFHYFREK